MNTTALRVWACIVACCLGATCACSGSAGSGHPPARLSTALPSSGHARSAIPAAGEQTVSVTVHGAARHVLVQRPSSGNPRRPLIVFLHGARSSPQIARDELAFSQTAAAAGVIVAYPAGDAATDSWRVGCCAGYADSLADIDFIVALIHDLVADGEVDPSHVALGGFSVGAYLVNTFACLHPELVRGVLAVAGSLLPPPRFVAPVANAPFGCSPTQPVTVLELHGSLDTQVPVAGSTSRCRSGVSCEPGNNLYIPSAATVDSWWRRIDGCGAPTRRGGEAAKASLATCRGGRQVGLAIVPGVGHDLAGLRRAFPVDATLIALARGDRLNAW